MRLSDIEHDTVTVAEVAQILRISKSTVLTLLHSKTLRGFRPAGLRRWLITKTELEAFIDTQDLN